MEIQKIKKFRACPKCKCDELSVEIDIFEKKEKDNLYCNACNFNFKNKEAIHTTYSLIEIIEP